MATRSDKMLADQIISANAAGFERARESMVAAIERFMVPERAAAKAMRDWMERRTKACESGNIPCWCGELDKLVAAYDAAVEER